MITEKLRATARAACGSIVLLAAISAASAATITVNSLADDVYMNASGQTFSDPGLTVPVAPAYCTLRMAIAAANGNVAVGGCTAGSGADTITFAGAASAGTITLSQVTMSEAPAVYGTSPPNWILAISSPVTITGPGSGVLTISGGGFSPGSVGRRSLLITDGVAATDTPVSISGVRFKEGRSVPTPLTGNPAVAVGSSGGCVFSRESLTLTDVIFENCETSGYGDANVNTGSVGGALGVGAAASGDARPNATLNNVRFIGNRTVHGSANAASQSAAGAAVLGNTTTLFMGAVSISNSQFVGNSSESIGALRINNASSVSISNTGFVSNTATAGSDGAFNINNISGTVTISGSGAVGNSAQLRRGAGQISTVGASLTPTDEVLTISDSSFIGNVALTQDIGGLSILTDSFDGSGNCNFGQLRAVRMTDVYFEKNIAAQNRGGLRVGCGANLTMTNVDFIANEVAGDNTASSAGNSAAQITDMGNITLNNILISGNKTFAGTIAGGGNVFTVLGPPSSGSVPAVYPLTSSLSATGLRVRDNWAQSFAPGVVLRANAVGRNYVITNSSFTGNSSPNAPYGLFFETVGNYTVRNSTFSGNFSTGGGGPALGFNTLAPTGSLQVLIENVTSARNGPNVSAFDVASYGGSTYNAFTTIRNTIFGQYQFGTGPGANSYNATAGLSYNYVNSIFENGSLPPGTCGSAGVQCSVDAKLEGLNYNGGTPGTFTHALRPGSPALDAGAAVATSTDQRGAGFPRVIGSAVDIGAFESPILAAVLPCRLDMDGDNQVTATKEGLVILRSMLGLSEATAVAGTGITQPQWNAARLNLNANCGTNFAP
jgi:CSLREA domain-containing protein